MLALYRLMAVGILVALQGVGFVNYMYIGSFIALGLYAIGYSLIYKFSNIPERVLVGVEEAALITIFALQTFMPSYISDYDTDFYVVCAIFVLELAYEIYKWVDFFKHQKANAEVTPADNKHGIPVNSFALDNSLEEVELNMKSQKRGGEASPLVSSERKQPDNRSPPTKRR